MLANYLSSLDKQFRFYRQLGERAMEQLSDEQLHWRPGGDGNSVAIIAQHIAGNARSRFTYFWTSDGEKPWRNRETEFDPYPGSRAELLAYWGQGWEKVFEALASVTPENAEELVYIRNQGHTVIEAFNRQLSHYAMHVGQMILLGKMQRGADWVSLSIPRGESAAYNAGKFGAEKQRGHFTGEWLE